MVRVTSEMHTGERTAGMWAMETQERFFHMRPPYPAKERALSYTSERVQTRVNKMEFAF